MLDLGFSSQQKKRLPWAESKVRNHFPLMRGLALRLNALDIIQEKLKSASVNNDNGERFQFGPHG
jgi:hypothetical protein